MAHFQENSMSLVDNSGISLETVETFVQLRARIQRWKLAGESIALVPTMGNLHDGHLALVKAATESGRRTVVSVFVNPMQFGVNEDFDTYPRTLMDDVRKLSHYPVDLVFSPAIGEIYPQGTEATTQVIVQGLSDILEGEHRPGFFVGVATVVSKLFNMVQPDTAWFGEKDYQQLLVIRKMVRDLAMPIEIRSLPTIREIDGLAMSSRNNYLDDKQRRLAVKLYRCLRHVVDSLQQGMAYHYAVVHACQELGDAGFMTDYVVVRRQTDLAVPSEHDKSLIVLAAARLGDTRLIDNIPFELM
jgi:pantoate--beta-alanine ligase